MQRIENGMTLYREPQTRPVTGEALVIFTVAVGALIGPEDTCWDEEQFKDAAEEQARARLQEALKSVSDIEIVDPIDLTVEYDQSPEGD